MLDLELDTSTPVGYFTMTVLAAVGELERKQIKQRTAAGKAARKAQGKFTGGGIPYGFKREGDVLVEHPEEQKTIQIMKRHRRGGKSYQKIADYLNSNGWLTRNSKNWYSPAVKRILEANYR
jgi:DNA invertase Pin-like site-specific DNA recombinase